MAYGRIGWSVLVETLADDVQEAYEKRLKKQCSDYSKKLQLEYLIKRIKDIR